MTHANGDHERNSSDSAHEERVGENLKVVDEREAEAKRVKLQLNYL